MLGGLLAWVTLPAGGGVIPARYLSAWPACCGCVFLPFTLGLSLPLPGLQEGIDWSDMARLWPAFPLIGGLAFWPSSPSIPSTIRASL